MPPWFGGSEASTLCFDLITFQPSPLPWLLLDLLSLSKLSSGSRIVGLGLGISKGPPLGALGGKSPPPLCVVLVFCFLFLSGVLGFYFSDIVFMYLSVIGVFMW